MVQKVGTKGGLTTMSGVTSPNIAGASKKPLLPPPLRGSQPETRPSTTRPDTAATLFGRLKAPVAAVMMAATLGAGCAAHGQTLEPADLTTPPASVITVDETATGTVDPEVQRQHARALNELYRRRDSGAIDAATFYRARAVLDASFVGRSDTALPRDHRGRIDVDALITIGQVGAVDAADMTRGELRFRQLGQELEQRMRVTARDMASRDFQPLEGAPGYKSLSEREVRSLLTDALQDIPLEELPGGAQLASLAQRLPNAGHLDAGKMTARELMSAVGDENRDWLKGKIEPLIEGRELEVGLVAFGAVTGLRYASEDAAQLMDKLSIRSTIYSKHSDDQRSNVRARLAYRDAHVFPDLDIDAQTTRTVADTTLRASIRGTFAPEADQLLTGTATIGAHREIGDYWVDGSGSYYSGTDRWRANVTVGRYDPATTWNFTSGITGVFGDGVAQGDANGRVLWETDLTRDVRFGNAVGDFGVYTGVGVDTDGKNQDVHAGLVFRLRF